MHVLQQIMKMLWDQQTLIWIRLHQLVRILAVFILKTYDNSKIAREQCQSTIQKPKSYNNALLLQSFTIAGNADILIHFAQ